MKREKSIGISRLKIGGAEIQTAGYDAQCKLLEVEFTRDGQVWQYENIPEEMWYGLRAAGEPSAYIRKNITGRFAERCILVKSDRNLLK